MKIRQSRSPSVFRVILCGALALAGVSCHAALIPLYAPATPPQDDLVCTSTSEVRALFLHEGTLWVATMGGVLQRGANNQWRKYTTRDGLPANEVRGFRVDASNRLIAQTPRGEAGFDGENWSELASPATKRVAAGTNGQARWHNVSLEATLKGLRFKKLETDAPVAEETLKSNEPKVDVLALPGGVGTHISALLPREKDVCVALFGDGLWLTDGTKWMPAPAAFQVPAEATEITALAGDKTPEWLGTRRDGIWHYENGAWKQSLRGDEPFNHNVQFMQEFKGALYVSTLEDGIAVRTGTGWETVGLDFLSSNAPRQMVEFKDALFVRHGGGLVDRCDGFSWQKDMFSALPRKKVLAIAADNERLYLGQWGGWSEWDGKQFTHHLTIPELQGLPAMALLADGDTLWYATQSRGLAEVDRKTEKVRWHDERHGLTDDWITCLLKVKDQVFAGTFVGGLVRWDGKHWQLIRETKGENVTALCEDGAGGIFITTRHGAWQRSANGTMTLLQKRAGWIEPEGQALLHASGGLWIGTRTGLFFLRSTSAKL